MEHEAEIDLDMEIRTVVYKIKNLVANGLSGVISQPAVARYFEQENPELIIKQVYSFKTNHQNQTVTLKIRVTKRKPAPIIALDVTINKGDGEGNHTVRIPASEEIPDDKILKPITDPARLLNAGPEETAEHGVCCIGYEELEKENATLKSAIEKFGNGQDFDWNVLARIDKLEEVIYFVINHLPESPDMARQCLVNVLTVGKQKEEVEGEGQE